MTDHRLTWDKAKALIDAGNPYTWTAASGGQYRLFVVFGSITFYCPLTDSSDITDFESGYDDPVVQHEGRQGLWDSSGNRATMDSSGALKTYLALPVPNPTLISVVQTQRVGASGAAETFTYVIPSGKTLNMLSFQAGAEVGVDGARVALYYAPAGSLNGSETIIANAYCNGTNFSTALSDVFVGNGTAAIILELDNLGGGTLEVFGRWAGERTP